MITDPLGASTARYTVVDITAEPGMWWVEEGLKRPGDDKDWVQTAVYIDGVKQPVSRKVSVPFGDAADEVHTVMFGNVQLGCIEVKKFNDLNANGIQDEGEMGVPKVTFTLTGGGAWGTLPAPLTAETDASGVARFGDLLPGKYTLEETVPDGWVPTTPKVVGDICVNAGRTVGPIKFGNVKPGCIEVWKFEDMNVNGVWDDGEPTADFEIRVTGSGPWGTYDETKKTGGDGVAKFGGLLPGDYKVEEFLPAEGKWFQTALWHGDGVNMTQVEPPTPSWSTSIPADGKVVVRFGNARPGCIEGEKFYDKNANGKWDEGELPLAGIKFVLTGGNLTEPLVKYTDASGKVEFCGLYPGAYKLEEVLPQGGGWFATTPSCVDIRLLSGKKMGPYRFGNVCRDTADFGTKGWWHNKNGNPLITEGDIAYLNSLDPYDDPTEYWETPFGSREEIGEFVVNNVSASPHRFQLAQQLAAFILNARHYAGGVGATIAMPGGTSGVASAFIDDAIAAWQSGDKDACTKWIGILDGFNNCDAVLIVRDGPCPIVY